MIPGILRRRTGSWAACALALAAAGCGGATRCERCEELEDSAEAQTQFLAGMLTLSYEYDANKIVVDLVRRMTTSKDDAERAAHVLAASVDDTHPLAQALKAIRTAMDVCANNIANANTTGFKRQRANFADTFYQRGESGDVPRGTGVKYVFYSQDFRQGPLEITGRSLDWAIEGEGYFCLDRGNGIRVYSRAGSFLRSRDGDIITSNGSRLDPPITIPENITDVSITMDGRVLGLDPSLPQQ